MEMVDLYDENRLPLGRTAERYARCFHRVSLQNTVLMGAVADVRFSDAIFLALFALIVCANIITFWKPPKLFYRFSFLFRYFSYICHG